MNLLTKITAILVAVVIVLSGLAYSPAHSDFTNDRYEYRVAEIIRDVRDSHDMRLVVKGACVDRYAERYNRQLEDFYYLKHSNLKRLLYRCDAYSAGEILGRGYKMPPRDLVRAWMRSPSHKDVILTRPFSRIGVSARRTDDGRRIVTANFIAK